MKLWRQVVLPLAFFVTVPVLAEAQNVRIPAGLYAMVADSSFTGGFDVTGIVSQLSDTTMTSIQSGMVLVRSKLEYSGDVVSMTDTEGQFMCAGVSRYKVTLTDRGFRILAIEDPCVERAQVLNQVSFVKQS